MMRVRLSRALPAALPAAAWPALAARAQPEFPRPESTTGGVLTRGPAVTEEESRNQCLELAQPKVDGPGGALHPGRRQLLTVAHPLLLRLEGDALVLHGHRAVPSPD